MEKIGFEQMGQISTEHVLSDGQLLEKEERGEKTFQEQ